MKLNLQYFAEENTEHENPDVNETPTVEEQPDKKPEVRTFTQEELDKIVADRIARERKKLEKFADYDDLKTKASEYEKQLEEKRLAELSAQERAEELAKKFEAERNDYAKQLEELNARIQREKIENAFIKVATALNVEYVDDALKLADLSAVTVDDEGVKGVEDVVKALVENKPFLLRKAKQEPKVIGDATQQKSDTSDKTAEQLLKEAAERARKSGRVEDKIAYAQLKRDLQA
ncbi:hypothetical protein WD019_02480 [Fictibacillus sp. Mic-4]|uniref:phage scaffolding protein n=1 Tax=Fictibacillus sp. Mic-4 TaxID=3132826 RepID=UPI003CF402B1